MLELIENDLFSDAFELGEREFDNWAGNTEFDYLYGIAARKANYHQHAIFAFERVILNNPNDLRARVALAVAYYELDNYKAARREFEQVLQLEPSFEIISRVDKYISLMDTKIKQQRQRFYGSVMLGYGYDSNANTGLNDDSSTLYTHAGAQINGFEPAATELYQYRIKLGYEHPIDKLDTLFIDLAVSDTQYQDFEERNQLSLTLTAEELQKSSANLVVGYRGSNENANFSYNAISYIQPFYLGGELYQNLYGVIVDGIWNADRTSSTILNLSYVCTDNQVNDNLDINQYAAKLSKANRFGQHVLSGSLAYTIERVSDLTKQSQHNERSIASLGISYKYYVSDWAVLAWYAEIKKSNHKHIDLRFFNQDRERFDKRQDLATKIGLQIDLLLSKNWTWQNIAKLDYRDSNVFLYELDKQVFTSRIQFKF
jgi:tetratricopeptide (TPR) repeat protein